jgi:hypothetical protein
MQARKLIRNGMPDEPTTSLILPRIEGIAPGLGAVCLSPGESDERTSREKEGLQREAEIVSRDG